MASPFDSIEEAIRDIKQGKFIILLDDEDRENEGDRSEEHTSELQSPI